MRDPNQFARNRAARQAVIRLAGGFSILALLAIWWLAGAGILLWRAH